MPVHRGRHQRSSLAKGVLVCLGLLQVTGCYRAPSSRLLGRWQGRPDTVADQTPGRQPAERGAASGTADAAGEADGPDAPPVTDWEQFDFTIFLDFIDRQRVRMSLAEGTEPIEGRWRVVEAAADRLTIQIVTPEAPRPQEPSAPLSSQDSSETSEVVRQFVIRFAADQSDRFALVEDGADPDLGRLLFERVR